MKCIKLIQTGQIKRLKDKLALTWVQRGKAEFINKDAWKRQEKRGKYAVES